MKKAILLLGLCMILMSSFVLADLEDYIVLEVRGEETGGQIIDYSIYNQSADVTDSDYNESGIIGGARHCVDGDSDRDEFLIRQGIPDQDVSICWWAKKPNHDLSEMFAEIKDATSTDRFRISTASNPGIWYGTYTSPFDEMWTTANQYAQNEWTHYCYTFERTAPSSVDPKGYINGVLNGSQTANEGADTAEGLEDIYICGRSDVSANYWDGYYDELVVFNKTLTASEVAAIYGNQSIGQRPWSPAADPPTTGQIDIVTLITANDTYSNTLFNAFQYSYNGTAGDVGEDGVATSLNTGLFAYFGFDSDNNLTDEVTGNYHMNGSVEAIYNDTLFKNGDGAYYFRGSDRLDSPDIYWDEIDNDGNMTLAIWIYPTNVDNEDYQNIFANTASNNEVIGFSSTAWSNNWQTIVGGTGGYPSPAGVTNANWYLLTVVKNGTNLDVFVNNTHIGGITNAGSPTHTLLRLGEYWTDTDHFVGVMDELMIWNRSLTDSEVSVLYNDGVGRFYPFVGGAPAAHCNILNGGLSNKALDRSSISANGTQALGLGWRDYLGDGTLPVYVTDYAGEDSLGLVNYALWSTQVANSNSVQNTTLVTAEGPYIGFFGKLQTNTTGEDWVRMGSNAQWGSGSSNYPTCYGNGKFILAKVGATEYCSQTDRDTEWRYWLYVFNESGSGNTTIYSGPAPNNLTFENTYPETDSTPTGIQTYHHAGVGVLGLLIADLTMWNSTNETACSAANLYGLTDVSGSGDGAGAGEWKEAYAYYKFDSNYEDFYGNYSLTPTNLIISGTSAVGNGSLYIGGSENHYAQNLSMGSPNGIRAFDFWYQTSEKTSDDTIFYFGDGSSNNEVRCWHGGSVQFECRLRDGASTKFSLGLSGGGGLAEDSWYHIVLILNSSTSGNAELWVNGTLQDNGIAYYMDGEGEFMIGRDYFGYYARQTYVDNFFISLEKYGDEDVAASYNNYNGIEFDNYSATTFDTTDLVAYYKFEGDFTDSHGSYDITNVNYNVVSGGLLGNQGAQPTASNGYMNTNLNFTVDIGSNFTFVMWVKLDAVDASTDRMWTGGNSNENMGNVKSGNSHMNINAQGTGWTATSTPIGEWQMWTWVGNHENVSHYVNTTRIATAAADVFDSNNEALFIGNSENFINLLNGTFDEISIWDRVLSDDEISDLYNNGAGLALSAAGAGAAGTLVADVCQLFTNETGSWIAEETRYSPPSSTTNTVYHNFPGDGTYMWNVGCNTTDNSTLIFGENNYSFTVDRVYPVIDFGGLLNNTIMYKSDKAYNLTFTDNNLHSVLITLDNTNEVFVLDNITGINGTEHNSSIQINYTNLNTTNYLYIRAADGHTAAELIEPDSYNPSNGLFNDYLKFDFESPYKPGELKIKQSDPSIFDSWDTEELQDRYKFIFKPHNKDDMYNFTIEADGYIEIVEDETSAYKKWIIYNDHWLDFMPYTNVTITRLASNQVEIVVYGVDDTLEEIEFNSVGDLNIVEYNYTFFGIFVTTQHTENVIEGQYHDVFLTAQTANTSLVEINVTLFYNGTSYLRPNESINDYNYSYNATLKAPTIVNVEENLTFYWNISVSGSEEQIELNQTIYQINIDNCTQNGSVEALRFIGSDEEGAVENFTMNLNIDLDVWFEIFDESRPFNFEFRGAQNYTLCIYPNTTTYNINAIMEYGDKGTTTGWFDRKYYLVNYTLNATRDDIYLYHLNATLGSEVTMQVFDQSSGDPVEGAYIKILRYYPGQGVYKVVEIERTNELGKTMAKLILSDVFYKYIIEYPAGTVISETEVEKVLSQTKNFPVNLATSVLTDWVSQLGVSASTSCTESTKTCRFTWSDTNNVARTGSVKVYRNNNYGPTLIYENSTTAAAGSIVYVISENRTDSSYSFKSYIDGAYFGAGGITNREWLVDLYNPSSTLFAMMLLIVAIAGAFLEVGAIGVILGSLLGFVGGFLFGVIKVQPVTIISLIAVAIIFILRLWKN